MGQQDLSQGMSHSSAPSTEQRTQLRAAGAMGAATLLSRIFGLVREQVFAYFFGASNATDAFQVAFRIPNLLRDLFAEGAMSAALVPSFTRARMEEGDECAWRLAGLVFRVLFVLVSLLSIVGILFAPQLVELYAASFQKVPGKFELTVRMTRVLYPFFPFVALAAAFMGILNACGRYFLPAFSSALFNIASVVSGLAFTFFITHTDFGRSLQLDGIEGMAWGVVVGGAVQALVQLPELVRAGYRFPTGPRWPTWHRDPRLKTMLAMMLPGTVGLAATQINLLVNTILATSQGSGAVSHLGYAFRLMQFPIGVFGVSLAAAILPRASQLWVRQDLKGMDLALTTNLRQMLAINLPASAGLAFLAEPIVRLIYQYGKFNSESAQATAAILMAYSAGLAAYSAVKVLVPAFYAIGDTRIPVISSVLSVALTLALNLSMVPILGVLGLPIGTSLAAVFNAAFLWFALRKRLTASGGTLSFAPLLKEFALSGLVSLGMGLLCRFSWIGLEQLWPEVMIPHPGATYLVLQRSIKVCVLVTEGVGFVVLIAKVFGLNEHLALLHLLIEKFRRKLGR